MWAKIEIEYSCQFCGEGMLINNSALINDILEDLAMYLLPEPCPHHDECVEISDSMKITRVKVDVTDSCGTQLLYSGGVD